jgi:dephospho-CoA kinase
MAQRPFVVALTGGIASGKSAVSAAFARHSVPILDADIIARQVVEPGQPALEAVVDTFGSGVLGPDGQLDRTTLRALIFARPEARRQLEGILHPAIRQAFTAASATAGGPYQIHAIPLLAESGRAGEYDRVLVVDCPRETQLQRLLARDQETQERAEAILAAQATREARLAVATEVITNTGTLDDLTAKVAELHAQYLETAASRS